MLGDGRPFVVELTKVKCLHSIDDILMEKMENYLNNKWSELKVQDLQISSKQDVKQNLKEGETEKTKVYTALCCIDRQLKEDDLKKLDKINSLQIDQKTPIRVLHRYDDNL